MAHSTPLAVVYRSFANLILQTQHQAHSFKVIDNPSLPLSFLSMMAASQVQTAVRHEWFQSEDSVAISVFIRKADPANVSVTFQAREVDVVVKQASGSEYVLNLELSHEIEPRESKYSVLGTKIEVKCRKAKVRTFV